MKRFVAVLAALFVSATLQPRAQDAQTIAIAVAGPAAAARAAALGNEHGLVQTAVFVDDLGQAHVRYQQTFRGIPVFEGQAIVHVDLASRSVVDITDALLPFAAIPTTPGLGADNARGRAFDALNLPPGLASRADLVIHVDNGVGFLAWQVRASGDDARGPIDQIALIEAQGRGVLRSWDNVQTAAAAGTGRSFFSGTVPLTTDQTSSYRLLDPSRGGQFTCDMRGKQQGPCYYMDDSDNVWGDFTLANAQTVAVDAQYGTAVTWDYYKNVHGRVGIAGDGSPAANRVHYGRNYANAFWSDVCFCMTYGDGDAKTYNPFDSLDVAGHEMTHGVTSRTANLTYAGESGGLNEGTSDIFGAMVEYYAANANDPGDYQVGERLYKKGGKALRYMYKPSLDGSSADCWYSNVGSLNVHYSSGIANHFYYLLAAGTNPAGGPASPTCSANDTRIATGTGSLVGIGREDAEKIWYRALTVYMTAGTTYAGARTATVSAVNDLFGAGSTQSNAVAAAWSAVKVN